MLILECGVEIHEGGSVLDFQAAEDDRTGDHQHFEAGVRGIIHAGGARFIFDSTKNGSAAKSHLPGGGYAHFHAAEDGGDCQSGFGPLDVGFSEIELDAAKNGGDVSALKILAGHAALQAAEDDGLVQRGAAITGPRSGSSDSRAPLS